MRNDIDYIKLDQKNNLYRMRDMHGLHCVQNLISIFLSRKR